MLTRIQKALRGRLFLDELDVEERWSLHRECRALQAMQLRPEHLGIFLNGDFGHLAYPLSSNPPQADPEIYFGPTQTIETLPTKLAASPVFTEADSDTSRNNFRSSKAKDKIMRNEESLNSIHEQRNEADRLSQKDAFGYKLSDNVQSIWTNTSRWQSSTLENELNDSAAPVNLDNIQTENRNHESQLYSRANAKSRTSERTFSEPYPTEVPHTRGNQNELEVIPEQEPHHRSISNQDHSDRKKSFSQQNSVEFKQRPYSSKTQEIRKNHADVLSRPSWLNGQQGAVVLLHPVDEEHPAKQIYDLFHPYGPITRVFRVDPQSCAVQFQHAQDARQAQKDLNRMLLRGMRVRVWIAEENQDESDFNQEEYGNSRHRRRVPPVLYEDDYSSSDSQQGYGRKQFNRYKNEFRDDEHQNSHRIRVLPQDDPQILKRNGFSTDKSYWDRFQKTTNIQRNRNVMKSLPPVREARARSQETYSWRLNEPAEKIQTKTTFEIAEEDPGLVSSDTPLPVQYCYNWNLGECVHNECPFTHACIRCKCLDHCARQCKKPKKTNKS